LKEIWMHSKSLFHRFFLITVWTPHTSSLSWIANNFTGEIPSELGLLSELIDLRLHENKLNGTIPDELFNYSSIFRIELSSLQLTGTLSTLIGRLTSLEQLRIKENQLTGTIPTELGNLKKLKLAWLHLNQLSGSMPSEVCENRGVTTLQFLNADCNPEFAPAVACDRDKCCTACCDNTTRLCDTTSA
jgi:hypothetical protein